MAELAARAVQSLLSVIRDETRLLGRVEADVKFIMEEMESMNSFLLHLSRSEGHGDPVRTWMNQVRKLADDCSNSIDHYLLCVNPAVYRHDRSHLGYIFWWVPLYMKKLAAQHKAAIQLSELKVRARDVADRRLRYEVHIPNPATTGSGGDPASESDVIGVHHGEEDEEEDYDEDDRPDIADRLASRELFFVEPSTKECRMELVEWLHNTQVADDKLRSIPIAASNQEEGTSTSSGPTTIRIARQKGFRAIAVVAPEQEEGVDVVSGAIFAHEGKFDYKFRINVFTGPMRMPTGLPAGAFDILEPIMNQLPIEQVEEAQLKTEAEIQEVNEAQQPKIQDIDKNIDKVKAKIKKLLCTTTTTSSSSMSVNKVALLEPIDILLHSIQGETAWVQVVNTDKSNDQMKKQKIEQTAKKIKEHMESRSSPVGLDHQEYVNILQKRLTERTDESQKKIKQITATTNAVLQDIKYKLQSKMAEKIKEYLAGKKTLILLIGMEYSYKWAKIIKALSSLGCAPGSAVVVTTRYTHGAEEFCYPLREPILCYLASSYYKKVLDIMMKQPISYNTSIFRDILEHCEPHQFSMKIFAHAMFANPRRKKEELDRLLESLAPRGSLDKTNDKKMIKFSYNDLPKDFKTCLLYLAIFQPKDDNKPSEIQDMINRSRLVGRWVVEGLITKQDWSSSVRQAERCFDALVDRGLICPADNIGATGKAKSCTVDATVHEFITKVVRKEHFVGTRLSRHMARQLSVFSDIRLRSSDILERSLGKLSGTPQLPLVKMLDLEGCEGLDNKNCLKHICNNMLLLKYLGLRNTGISKLPKEINNLHQLEVLDIRQKKNIVTASTRDVLLLKLKRLAGSRTPTNTENIVTVSTTRDVLLLKLKRLLAGSSTPTNTEHAQIPRGIANMTDLEVLSSVKASLYRDFKDIGRLWQLRKLGVVIDDDKPRHLTYLLEAIGDLSESLRSLSITLTHGKDGTHNHGDIAGNIGENYSKNPPKLLESLSIDGYTCKGQLLPWLLKDNKLPALAKVTLCNTFLKEGNMEHLAELDNLCCLRLMCGAYTDSRLSFLCAKFNKLKYLLVECGKPNEISFDVGAAPELSKIVLSFTSMEDSLSPSLSGINNLTKLKELEYNRDEIPSQVIQDIANHPNKKNLALKRIKARQGQEASASAAAP